MVYSHLAPSGWCVPEQPVRRLQAAGTIVGSPLEAWPIRGDRAHVCAHSQLETQTSAPSCPPQSWQPSLYEHQGP